jgi:hypothetical protein
MSNRQHLTSDVVATGSLADPRETAFPGVRAEEKLSSSPPGAQARPGGRHRWVPPRSMLFREEDVEMRADSGFSPRLGPPLRFDHITDRMRRLFRDKIGRNCPPSCGIARSSVRNGKRGPMLRISASPRRGLMEDMADLLARTVLYVMSMLGLLHVLDLVAVVR